MAAFSNALSLAEGVEVKLPQRKERRVAFWGKCQVIPPTYFLPEDPVDNYFARKGDQSTSGKKASRIHFPFRSHKNARRWSNASPDQRRSKSTNSIHEANKSTSAHHSRSHSVPVRAPSLSPTLHISRDGTANRLRQKLVSPPPPSPMGKAIDDECEKETTPKLPTSPASPKQDPLPLARPVAVRKPLMFGFGKDEEQETQNTIDQITQNLSLRIPPIIYVHSISNKAVSSDHPAAAVLNWEESEDRPSSISSSEEVEKDEEEEAVVEVFEEEDLHGECNCPDCEVKMLAALAPTYTPHWTRSARRKYLADRKEAINEQSRKSFKPPIWLKTEESELADSSSKLRDIQADEVDAKHGQSQKEIIDKKAAIEDHTLKQSAALPDEEATDDTILQKEVDQEVRLREEESRAKRTRNEMKRLSSDLGSGLRLGGGGGARAMMRQLEEAEQAERRAKIERARSPKSPDEVQSPTSGKIEIPSPGIESPTVNANNLAVQAEKTSRTPSPLKRMFSNGNGAERKSSQSDPAPLRRPSPSLLIKRELALGIPIQPNSNANPNLHSRSSRQTWNSAVPGDEGKNSMMKVEEDNQRSRKVRAEAISNSRRPSFDERRSSTDQRPSSNLRRANTTGSRGHSISTPPLSIPAPASGHPSQHLHGINSSNNVVDKARAKAKSSFKDLVARMKN